MITIFNFENYILPKILERGEDYYASDAVSELKEYPSGEWHATVSGTDDYEVTISLSGDEIISWECDCPYDGSICKHVVATLMAIRHNRNEGNTSQYLHDNTPQAVVLEKATAEIFHDSEVEQILSFAEPCQLSDFVLEYASSHIDFKEALMQRFLPERQDEKLSAEYEQEIEACFESSSAYGRSSCYGRYYEPEIDWDEVYGKLNGYLAKATLLFQHKALNEAAVITLQILHSVGSNYLDGGLMDMYEGDVGYICEAAGELLLEVVQHPDASQALKSGALDKVNKIANLEAYCGYDLYDVDELVQQITLCVQTKEEALLSLDRLIIERQDHYELYKLVLRKVQLLQDLDRKDEAEATLAQFLYLPEIRRQEVEKLLKEKCYPKAIELLNKGVSIAEKNGDCVTLYEWRKQLLSIYEEMRNVPEIIKTCRLLFIGERGELIYYHKLKSLIPAKSWKEYLAQLMGETAFSLYWGDRNNKADIFVEEEDFDSLFSLLSAVEYHRMDALMHYAPSLNATHAPQVLALFADDLRVYAENNLGRNHYTYIAKVLRVMQKLDGGRAAVKQLIGEFRILYKRRPAMMQELGEFMG